MKIGERIKQRRKFLGLSVDELAEKLGKNRATIYRYESNEIEKLPTTVLEPLAKALKTTPAYLMGWEEPHYGNRIMVDGLRYDGRSQTEIEREIVEKYLFNETNIADKVLEDVKHYAKISLQMWKDNNSSKG